ncbi:MAG: SDR family oxidoreductase, partial [Candidatus Binataceae bacterium]
VQAALDSFGRLEILVNNAGIVRPRIIYNMSESDWDDVIAVHMKGTFSTIRAAAMIFREHKTGVIVNTASESGLGHLGQSSYSAAKEGIVGFTRTIARDLGRFNVRCNAIRPRAATRLFDQEALKAMERTRAMLGDRGVPVPMANPLDNKPEQVAALVVWLCTDAAANVNGRTFVVGGEMVGIYPEPEPSRTMIREGGWDLDALDRTAPSQLTSGLRNEFLPRS